MVTDAFIRAGIILASIIHAGYHSCRYYSCQYHSCKYALFSQQDSREQTLGSPYIGCCRQRKVSFAHILNKEKDSVPTNIG